LPKLIDFKKINTLGVINLTPNSFSDQNKFLNSDALTSGLLGLKSITSLAFDFGFESTAPMNFPVTKEEERARFDLFFDQIKDIDLSGRWISFDTYKCQNFLYFEEKFRSRYNDCGLIFNDVSGVIDNELLSLLTHKKNQENFYYIYTYTHIPSRDSILKHMEYLREGDIVQMCLKHLRSGYEKFIEIGVQDKIIFDPGFGFSKSYNQNWDLLNRFEELNSALLNDGIMAPYLIGISKKSFLRNSLVHSSDPFKDSEIIHAKLIKDLVSKNLGHIIFRAHDPMLVLRSIIN